jgi:CBS domain containing-hemolysin-like protein
MVLIFAEITAKSLALTNIRYALFVAPAVGTITAALRPLLRGMSGFARLMARVRGTARGPFVTEDELMVLLSVGEEEGVIEEEEREMIHGIIEIGDKSVREVMVPRVDIDAVEVHRPVQEIIDMILKQGHTRVPVFEGDIDHIIGIAYAKDLLRYRAERRDGDVRSLLRPAYFVPENRNLSEFLHEMRQNRVHMSVVLDEYGGVSGLVTIEDIIEEIVGPIRDEYDAMEEEDVHFTAPNEAVLDARIGLGDARELLGLELAAEDVDSLGGFILSRLGRVARSGESIEVEGAIMTVVNVLGQRIGKVRVRSQTAFPGAHREEGAEVSTTEAQPGTRKAG